jgi:two-component system sensor histidine kinase/response regulator
MPTMPGVQLLEEAVRRYPIQSRILTSAYSDIRVLDIAVLKCQIFDYVSKPWNMEQFRTIINAAHQDYLDKCSFEIQLQQSEIRIGKLDREIEEVLEHVE